MPRRRRDELTICMPCYNESKRIPATLREIAVFMRKYPGLVREVVVADDGSKDNSIEMIMSMMNELPVRVEILPRNKGKWAAVRTAIAAAKTDAIVLLDADGSASIWELERMGVERVKEAIRGKKIIFGSRFMHGAKVEGKNAIRTVISYGYRVFVRCMYWWATGKRDVDDMQCPLKLIYKSTMLECMEVERFAGDIELACMVQGEITNVPVLFFHKAGGSVKAGTIIEMFMETVNVARRFRRFRNGGLYSDVAGSKSLNM